ncbi:hypothetical protein ACJMK2_001912 [Sinanodonta woodiana]|uniref:Uncharacterized protein n=1 Tax=Sinanodonta woodiana TaxID=1069815 RepID=A0ABD3XTN2_SINWO
MRSDSTVPRVSPTLSKNFHGISAARVTTFLRQELPSHIPDIIFSQIGENEVRVKNPSVILSDLQELCMRFINIGVRYVLIGAFLTRSRPRWISSMSAIYHS